MGDGEEKEETHEMLRCLRLEEQERVSVLQQLLATAKQPKYGARQRAVAEKMGMTRSQRAATAAAASRGGG